MTLGSRSTKRALGTCLPVPVVEKKVEKVREVTELLPLVEDPHTEFALLRSCLSLPKLSFLLRAVDTSDHS